ncbi:hypothetical protein BYT27DRAFT_6748074 [Phlegmacium glaucopus]|nr:hypothetical protein BYT27DRAFT_6748074 [Phlegmacium glaucopus]
MCHYRQFSYFLYASTDYFLTSFTRVCNIYLRCGHRIQQPDEHILCASPRCKFSPNHSPLCTPPACTQTCTQFRRSPEQYSPHIDRMCPYCERA